MSRAFSISSTVHRPCTPHVTASQFSKSSLSQSDREATDERSVGQARHLTARAGLRCKHFEISLG